MEKMVDMGFNGLMMVPPSETAALYGGSVKQERSHNVNGEDDEWRSLKIAKNDDFSTSKTMLLQQRSHQQQQQSSLLLRSASVNNNNNNNSSSLFPDGQMLSFSSSSSSKSEASLPYFQPASASSYNRSYAGYGSGSLNGASMHGVLTGLRGHFTPSQWMELERQALIYKYIDANVPIPASLLITMRRGPESGGFPTFSTRADAFGWGAFHLGFANNTDPEPGRCRRTDGKKWRCSRDAVADQKYCERHMNRGRHRSRKPVEGQSGHSAATSVSNNITTTTAQNAPVVVMQSGSGTSNGLAGGQQHQVKNLLPGVSAKAPPGTIFNRASNGGMQDTRSLSMMSSSVNQNPKESMISAKQQLPFGQSPRTQFGLVSTDSLLNPSHGGAPFPNCKNYSSSENLSEHKQEAQHPSLLRHFMDDWPKMQQDQTQLSISIPMSSSDYNLSSTSSPPNEKNEFSVENPLQMGLGLGSSDLNDQNLRQQNLLPITWETSVGGPLGEALHISHNNNAAECKNAAALNLMSEGWDGSPAIGSSPTGVLQKAALCSLSNSSAGSSPRAEASKTHERSALCNDLLGSALARSSDFPYL